MLFFVQTKDITRQKTVNKAPEKTDISKTKEKIT